MGAREIHVDAGTYPIARWGAERARCSGAVVRLGGLHIGAFAKRSLPQRLHVRTKERQVEFGRHVLLRDGGIFEMLCEADDDLLQTEFGLAHSGKAHR